MNPTLVQISENRRELRFGSLAVTVLTVKNGPYTNYSLRWKMGRQTSRASFSNEEKALQEAERILRELVNSGGHVAVRNVQEQALIEYCISQLGGVSKLPEAVRCYHQVHSVVSTPKPLDKLVEEYLTESRRRELSKRYIETIVCQTNILVRWFESRPISEITAVALDRELQNSNYSPVTKKKILDQFAALENYAKRKGYLPKAHDTIIRNVAVPRVRLKTYPVFTPDELMRLFIVLRKDELAYVATMAFGGSRRAEFERLTPDLINIEDGSARITAEAAKKGVSRALRWPDNLREWMQAAELPKDGPIITRRRVANISGDKYRLGQVGLEWRNNVLRHSFCSYHLMKFMSPANTAYLGGTSPRMLDRHYASLVTTRAADEWFNITPASVREYAAVKGLNHLIQW